MWRDSSSIRNAASAGLDDMNARMTGAATFSIGVSAAIVISSWGMDTRLGVPQWWPWVLTGLQVTALWAAGSKRWWGWLLGAAVQPPWIVYALLTGQLGFIPGCAISAVVQTYSFLRKESRRDQRSRDLAAQATS